MILKKAVKILFALIFALGFLLFLAPVFTKIINIGNIAGMAVCAVLSCISLLWDRLFVLFRENGIFRKISIAVMAIAVPLIILAVVISVFMVRAANSPPKEPKGECTVIVLGCKVRGETPSSMLYYRAMSAYRYLEANPSAVCVASGGQGADELISEAECVKRILLENGIAEERIILEDKSTSTEENIRFSLQKMEEYGISGGSVALATNEFHQLRAQMIAESCGLESFSLTSHTLDYLLPTYWLREWFGVTYQFLFGGD